MNLRGRIVYGSLVIALAATSAVQAQEKKIKRAQLPATVEKTVKEQSEGATIKGAHQAAARAALDIFETEIEKLKETHSPNGDSANEPTSAESPPARIPITDTIF